MIFWELQLLHEHAHWASIHEAETLVHCLVKTHLHNVHIIMYVWFTLQNLRLLCFQRNSILKSHFIKLKESVFCPHDLESILENVRQPEVTHSWGQNRDKDLNLLIPSHAISTP